MKKSRITLLAASIFSLALGIGGVLALDVDTDSKTQNITIEDAIYLYWGDEEGAKKANITIEGVDNLVSGHNKYRYVSILPKASTAAEASITITYSLSCTPEPGDANLYDLNGLTVKVYRTATDLRESKDNPNLSGLEPTILTYDSSASKNEVSTVFNYSSSSTAAYYCLEFVLASSHDPATGHIWGGKMTISQDFTAVPQA